MISYTDYTASSKEVSISCQGLNFLCICGIHINGGYVAILNWGVAAELSGSEYQDGYNCQKILAALRHSPLARSLPSDKVAKRDLIYEVAEFLGGVIRGLK